MDIFEQHEKLEMDVLDLMRRSKLLDPLVFGGGTMLRLCHELNRYSADLDFWLVKPIDDAEYFRRLQRQCKTDYEITDAKIKHYTILLELRAAGYPKRLKIEIRKEGSGLDFQEQIAFSRFSNKQVILRAITLEQAMRNKIAAFADRGEVRDGFDIEFLLRKGISLPVIPSKQIATIRKKIERLKETDYKVKLGSILESEAREYYTVRKFDYLKAKLDEITKKK